jgi:CBS domain containing-hemolysin-like protein
MGYNEEDMIWFLAFLCLVVLILLIVVSSVIPTRTLVSTFELERREAQGDKHAAAALRKDSLFVDMLAIQRSFAAILLVLLVGLLVVTFGWAVGLFLSVVIALEHGSVARLRFVRRRVRSLYEPYEPKVLAFAEKYRNGGFRLITNAPLDTSRPQELSSREELEHLIAHADTVLSKNDKELLLHGLAFGSRQVSEVMSPRSVIDSISKKELLGPLVLDDLHKTGHSRFPVTDDDIDHIVGILHIQDLLVLDAKKRSTIVEKVMEPRVFYIHQDQMLYHALAAFLRTRHHLFIVVNEFRETVGLLSLEDVIEVLLGRKIIDEFDAHDDLRTVAARKSIGNNQPEKGEDV